jgi:hypothetical protein
VQTSDFALHESHWTGERPRRRDRQLDRQTSEGGAGSEERGSRIPCRFLQLSART